MTSEVKVAADQLVAAQAADKHEHWTLDKKIPIAIILALLAQGGTLAWWAASLEGRVGAAGQAIIELKSKDGEQRADRERSIRLEERIISMLEEQRRMNGKLELLLDERRPRPR